MTEQPTRKCHDRRPGSHFMKAMRVTTSYRCKRAVRTPLVALAIAVSVALFPPSALADSKAPSEATGTADPEASYFDLQQQVNELRSDLLDERERRIGHQMEANGAALVVLGVVVGLTGLWLCSRFRAIASAARVGATIALHHVQGPRGLIAGPGAARELLRDGYQSLTFPVSGGWTPTP